MGNPIGLDASGVPVTCFFSPAAWIEGDATSQLLKAAGLPGMSRAAAFPDLHPGRGIPIGAAFLAHDRFYPHLIGNDIGCGIGLWSTTLPVRKPKTDRWAKRLAALEADGDADGSIATIGGGNHFAELTRVAKAVDPVACARIGLTPDVFHVAVHAGSRGLGNAIFRDHAAAHGGHPLLDGTAEAEAYLARHDQACRWAKANREAVAMRMASLLGATCSPLVDTTHNGLSRTEAGWIHRKGASEADQGPVFIAGTRGTPSFLVQPNPDIPGCLASLAHGAGRRWHRGDARDRLRDRFSMEQMRRTPLGGQVICQDPVALYEEAPQAYKDIEAVIADLQAMGLASVIAIFEPIITYKNV